MVRTIHPAPLDYNLWSDILTISVASSSSTFRASAFSQTLDFRKFWELEPCHPTAICSGWQGFWQGFTQKVTFENRLAAIWSQWQCEKIPDLFPSIGPRPSWPQPARAPNTSTFLDLTLKSGLVRCCPIWSPLMSLCPGKGKHFGRGIPPEKLNV